MTTKAEVVDIFEIIDTERLSWIQVRILVLCSLVALLDGFDSLVIGYAAPAFSSSLHLGNGALGAIFSAGTLGSALGALGLGSLADRLGRKPVLTASTLVFSACAIATAIASSFDQMLIARFLAGLGLGGATPCCLALASEYAPKRFRAPFTTLVWSAFPVGGIIGGICASFVIPEFGWRPLFFFGGAFPAVLCIFLIAYLKESPGFLLGRNDGQKRLAQILKQIAPDRVDPQKTFVNNEAPIAGGPVQQLFLEGRATPTLLLWFFFFITFMLLIVIALWSPTLLHGAGLSVSSAAILVTLNAVGSTLGVVASGQLVGRFRLDVMLLSVLVLCTSFTALIGISVFSAVLAGFCLTLSGFFAGATAGILIALATFIYPSAMRSTGIGWAMAIGRLGQIVGPALGGVVLLRNWNVVEVYFATAVPLFAASVLAFVVWRIGNLNRAPN